MQYLESKLNQHQVFTRVLYPSRVLALLERGKPGGPGEKPSEKDESQQQTRPTHDTGPESSPGHIVGKWMLSPLRHPYSRQGSLGSCFSLWVCDLSLWWRFLTSLFICLFSTLLRCFHSVTSIVSILRFSNDVNVTDQDGNTALHLAAISSKTECMRVLLRAGATDSLGLGMFIMQTTHSF